LLDIYLHIVRKIRFHPEKATRAQMGSRGIALLFHDLGTRCGCMVNVTPRPPGTHCKGGWVGPRADLDRCGKSRPHRHSIARPSSP